jgi:hypothetical protein
VDVAATWISFKQSSTTSGLFYRLLSLGLGWTLAHHLANYFPGFWIHARSLQFTYDSITEGVSSLSFFVRMHVAVGMPKNDEL